jgi:transposase
MKRSKALDLRLSSQTRARGFLREKAWPNRTVFCVRCRSRKIYRLAEKRYRCGECGYTFQEFAGRWIAELQMSAAQWLWALKLFDLELTPDRFAAEIGISHPTALKAIRLIRLAILQRYLSAKPTADPYWHHLLSQAVRKRFKSAPNGSEPLVFQVYQRGSDVEIAPARGASAAQLRNLKETAVKLGPIFSVVPGNGDQALLFWGGRYLPATMRWQPAVRSVVRGPVEEFLAFVSRRLSRVRRLSRRQFPLYLVELKFRFDHRAEDTFELLAGCIAQLVPNR